MRRSNLLISIQAFTWIILFSACNSNSGGASGEAYSIKMRLKEGDKFAQNMNMKMNMQAAVINMNMNMEVNSDFEVIKSEPNQKEIKMTYTKLHTSLDAAGMPGAKTEQDSIINGPNRLAVGKSLYLTVDANNKITDVKGFEELFKGDSTMDPNTRMALDRMFSKEQVNNMMGFMFSMYPNKPVKVGDSWNATTTTNVAGMNMDIKVKYTLRSVNNGVASIQVDGEIDGQGTMAMSQQQMNMKLSGDQKGQLNITLEDGYLKDGNYKMNVKAEMDMMGTKLPMTMTADANLKGK
jgi:carbon monoxide dehydrogenase subunit G